MFGFERRRNDPAAAQNTCVYDIFACWAAGKSKNRSDNILRLFAIFRANWY
jgi:hypothetical protein